MNKRRTAWLTLAGLMVLVLVCAPGALVAGELTESQKQRLMNARDRSTTVDEPAFFALLENARQALTEQEKELTQMLKGMRENPSQWRGAELVITGTLDHAEVEPVPLQQSGWEKVRLWYVRLPNGEPAMVYLTDPPDIGKLFGVIKGWKRPVKIPVRFYKLLTRAGRDGTTRDYLVFVGKGDSPYVEEAAATPWQAYFISAAALGGFAFYMLWRIRRMRRPVAERPSIADRLTEIRDKRAGRLGEGEDEDVDETIELPADPAAALEALHSAGAARKREEENPLPKDPAEALKVLLEQRENEEREEERKPRD